MLTLSKFVIKACSSFSDLYVLDARFPTSGLKVRRIEREIE